VFVKAVHEAKWMSEMEISIYDSWFDPMVSALPGLIPDGFIYLRATPDTCHKRMMLRKRSEEGGVSLDYLRDLHEKHESWLFPSQSGNHGVLSVSKLPLSLDSSLHPDIQDRCFLLEGPNMHPSIQKVPALVLDCETNIDLDRDVEAKQHYARQVAEFFSFVKRAKEVISPNKQNGKSSQQQVVLPQNPGLWVPNQMQFPDPAFTSLIEEPFRTSLASARDGHNFCLDDAWDIAIGAGVDAVGDEDEDEDEDGDGDSVGGKHTEASQVLSQGSPAPLKVAMCSIYIIYSECLIDIG
ncbi:Deoxycytidine kinase-like protein, partial [Drosera capensis]